MSEPSGTPAYASGFVSTVKAPAPTVEGADGWKALAKNGSTDEPHTKRPRTDNNEPCKVVHVRNLNPNATEADLLEALGSYGTIAYATVVPQKRMALVEFDTVEAAEKCVEYTNSNEIYVAGAPAAFSFSMSKSVQRLGLESENPNNVVVISISNVQYPINVDVIYKIAKPYGKVRKIAMVRKAQLQALVEFDDIPTATKAKLGMNGADIYAGCCTLKVEYAKTDQINVVHNDQDKWDFTKTPEYSQTEPIEQKFTRKILIPGGPPPLPGGQPYPEQPPYGYNGPVPAEQAGAMAAYGSASAYPSNFSRPTAPAPAPPPRRGLFDRPTAAPAASAYPGYEPRHAAGMSAYGAGYDAYGAAAAGHAAYGEYDYEHAYGYGHAAYDKEKYGSAYDTTSAYDSQYDSYVAQYATQKAYNPSAYAAATPTGYQPKSAYGSSVPASIHYNQGPAHQESEGAVVMMYGISHATMNCDKVFNIMCIYGNPQRVKFIKTKTDACMVQFAKPEEVLSAIHCLHGATLFGNQITLTPSKQPNLRDTRDPFTMPDGTPSTKDYLTSRHLRFTSPTAAQKNRVIRPTATLLFFNAPPDFTPEKCKTLFQTHGVNAPHNVIMFAGAGGAPQRSSSGLAEFSSEAEATDALTACNHAPVDSSASSHPFVIKFSFAVQQQSSLPK